MKRASKKRRSKKRGANSVRRARWIRIGAYITAALLLVAGVLLAWLDYRLIEHFRQRHMVTPVHVYSAPIEWFPGNPLTRERAAETLIALGYRRVETQDPSAGSFQVVRGGIDLATRAFTYSGATHASRRVRVTFTDGYLAGIVEQDSGVELPALSLDPVVIGSLATRQHEDRKILKLHELPDRFLKVLLLVEDRHFMSHVGIDPLAIARALVANIRSGRVTQGGSTITQQLVKNLYLGPEQTLVRKLKEAIYALMLELHFDKHEILEAYVNEVFLAQAGNRAIHGFALGSEHFFGRPLGQLELQDFALLVGMVKAPSSYNPRRYPERSLERRNVVLNSLASEGLIEPSALSALLEKPLGVVDADSGGGQPYAAFLDLVRRQFAEHGAVDIAGFRQLKVWSTMDPVAQQAAEQALADGLARIEQQRQMPSGVLQGAAIVLRAENGQVVALVGDRRRGYAGFNRALDAQRPVGSLLKPVIALSAFESPRGYHLASLVEDEPFSMRLDDGSNWSPGNYDGEFHGVVTIATTMEQSYNAASARLGVEVGVGPFVSRLAGLGLDRTPPAYPSALLGAVEMSPLDVSRLYLPFASGGLGFPVRGFVAATDDRNRMQVANPSSSRRLINPDSHFLVHHLLQGVVERGTASRELGGFGTRYQLAGKTGTTDDYRDSWFAGYSGNYLAVVWVGRDDNMPTGLSGSTGALPVWRELMQRLPLRPASFEAPAAISWHLIDPVSGLRVGSNCADARRVPFAAGSELPAWGRCGAEAVVQQDEGRVKTWLKRIFSSDGSPPKPGWNESGRR